MGESRRTKLLVSVRSLAEAREALAGGGDWIDLKEPREGALGPVKAAVAREVAAEMSADAPLSAAAGELVDWKESNSRPLLDVPGVAFFKLGLAGCRGADWRTAWRTAQAEIARGGAELALVAYADAALAGAPPAEEVIDFATTAPGAWLLIDTFDKSHGTLTDHLPPPQLLALMHAARAAGRKIAVAGSLGRETLATFSTDLRGAIDMVAVRGAACVGDRSSRVVAGKVAELRAILAVGDAFLNAREPHFSAAAVIA